MNLVRKIFPLLAVLAFLANAGTYYVSTTGNDANTGTVAQPFRTIAKGLSGRAPGDTLFIRGGIYPERITSFPPGESWDRPITIAAYPGEDVTIRPGAGGSVLFFNTSALRYLVCKALTIDAINQTAGFALEICAAHHIRFQKCTIQNSYESGIIIGWANDVPATNIEFIGCTIHHSGRWGGTRDGVVYPDQPPGLGRGMGFYVTSPNNKFDSCRIYDNGECGIQILHDKSGFNAYDNQVSNNRIYGNGYNTTRYGTASFAGIFIGNRANGTIAYNNLVYRQAHRGIMLGGDPAAAASGAKIYNNTLYNNGAAGIMIEYAKNTLVKNNISFPQGIGAALDNGTTVYSNNLTKYPKFADSAESDFRLLAGSPAIDSGVTLSEVAKDFAGTARPQGHAFDIGAYEYATGSAIEPIRVSYPNGNAVKVRSAGSGKLSISWDGKLPARASVYSLNGQRMGALDNMGNQGAIWHSGRFGAGVSLVQVRSGKDVQTSKIILGK